MGRSQLLDGSQIPSAAPVLGRDNVLLRASARRHFVQDFPGPLSIKSVIRGKAAWRHDSRWLPIEQQSFLILPDGAPYSLDIDARQPVHTCCAFFAKGFVESVYRDITNTDLDGSGPVRLEFLAQLHPRDERLLRRMQQIGRIADDPPPLWTEQQFLLLARDLLALYREVNDRIARLPARKQSTREEIYRRVSRGRDFIHAHAFRSVKLAELARASFLSPYHFHRAFTSIFGVSPHEYLTRLRIDKAAELLKLRSDLTVTAVAGEVGFESPASFTNLFRKRLGTTPLAFRTRRNSRTP